MHPNPVYRHATEQENLDFARDVGFGVLAVNGSEGPLISHVPFLLSTDGTGCEFHLVRSNPIARALHEAQPVRIAVNGPHSYVSPDWYGIDDQVPTWNYVAVHLSGTAQQAPDDVLHDLLDRLSAQFEQRLLPKQPWVSAKMSEGVMARMMRQIVPFTMQVAQIEGTWKLNQNKTDDVRHSAADHIDGYGMGSEVRLLSAMMRNPPQSPE
jgi:transcriptional regulator